MHTLFYRWRTGILATVLLTSLGLSGFVPLNAQQGSSPKASEAIQAVISRSFDDIFSDYDSEKVGQYYTEDFLLLEVGEVWTLDSIYHYLDRARQREARPERRNEFEFIRTEITGNTAWVAYHNRATFWENGKQVREINWLESAVLQNTASGWKIRMLHSTRKQ